MASPTTPIGPTAPSGSPTPAPRTTPDTGSTAPRRKHYPSLDGLRGVAVLAVMLLHFTLYVPSGPLELGLSNVLNTGWLGVDLFFVLSGFLITGILMETRDDPHYFRNFYARRTLRIFPLYYAYLFLLFVVLPLLSAEYAAEHVADDRRMWLWTYLGNILMGARGWEGMPSHTTHLWSLAVEEQFYLVWPLLVLLVPKTKTWLLCAATFAGAVLTRIYLVAHDAPAAAYVLTPARMDTLAAGALVAVALHQQGPDTVRRLKRGFAAAGCLLVTVALLSDVRMGVQGLLPALDPRTELFAYPGFAMLFAAVVAQAVTAPASTRTVGILSSGWLRMFGKYSYALYLIHVPLRNVLERALSRAGGLPHVLGSEIPAQVLLTIGGIAVSLAAAHLSWAFFEKPILGLKRYFEPTRPAGATT